MLRFSVKNLIVVGGFLSTIRVTSGYGSGYIDFSTDKPLTTFSSNVAISQYSQFGQSNSWSNVVNPTNDAINGFTPNIANNAYWVWGGANPMVFTLNFANHQASMSELKCKGECYIFNCFLIIKSLVKYIYII